MKLVIKTTIQQAAAVVFAFISDPRNEMQWNADLIAVEGDELAQWGVGSRCTMVFADSRVDIRVTELVPLKRYSFASEHGTSTYQVRGNDERTRIVFETEVLVRGVMLQTLKRAALKRSLETRLEENFTRLKEVLEQPTLGYGDEGYGDEGYGDEGYGDEGDTANDTTNNA